MCGCDLCVGYDLPALIEGTRRVGVVVLAFAHMWIVDVVVVRGRVDN